MRIAACAVLLVLITGSSAFAQAPASGATSPSTVTACVVTLDEYARANTVNAVSADGSPASLVAVDSPIAYALSSEKPFELATLRHRRVVFTGRVIAPESGSGRASSNPPTPSGAAGANAAGSAAHEPGDAAQPRASASPASRDGRTLRRLPTLVVSDIRPTGESCDEQGAVLRAASAGQSPAPSVEPPTRARENTTAMIASGCVVREASTGTLTLQRATVAPASPGGGSAVPGSRPSSSGTGTVAPVGTTGGDAAARNQSFLLTSPPAELSGLVGRQVEVRGQVTEPAARGGDAHESTPSSRLTVASFRVLRDKCP